MIEEGARLPDIALETPDGGTVRPSDYEGRKLALYFYPKDNTPGCTTEAKDFSALKDAFADAGTAILGVSRDSAQKHRNFTAKHDLTIDLATDADGAFCEAMGVWQEKQMYGKSYMGIQRSTFLIGADGKVARSWPTVKVKGHAEAVLETARAL